MSLRTTFTGALDAKLAQARQAGYDFVTVDNLASITTDITTAAGQGKKKFTLSYTVTYQPQDLRLLGPLWSAYQTGVVEGLASEDIMMNEVVVKLNTNDSLTTKIDMEFTF
jgi:hypothetical protein